MIRTQALVKRFAGHPVLNGVDFSVDRGETVFIIGRSGEGKSVFLKCLMGLIAQDSGDIWVDGSHVTSLPPLERYRMRLRFGMLFQNGALFDSLSVGENVAFPLLEHTKWTPKEIGVRVAECLDLVGLKGIEKRTPSELSGGMRKRVALARAISMRPDILLFDEPTSGLDPITTDAINQLMIQLKQILKVTCVAVSHDMASAFRVADRISLLHDGAIRVTARPEDLKRSHDPLVRQFIEGGLEETHDAHTGKHGRV